MDVDAWVKSFLQEMDSIHGLTGDKNIALNQVTYLVFQSSNLGGLLEKLQDFKAPCIWCIQ